MMEVFFYGLFMDEAILLKNGVQPTNPRRGFLENYTLKIGRRASLIPSKNDRAWGIVMTANKDALDKLYAEASVADYIPEEVEIIVNGDKSVSATCYNLPAASLSGTNVFYAQSLYGLGVKLGLPKEYLEKIKAMAEQ